MQLEFRITLEALAYSLSLLQKSFLTLKAGMYGSLTTKKFTQKEITILLILGLTTLHGSFRSEASSREISQLETITNSAGDSSSKSCKQ